MKNSSHVVVFAGRLLCAVIVAAQSGHAATDPEPVNHSETKLTAKDGEAHDQLGTSVSLWGNTAVVGAPRDDDNGLDSGAAYVFVRHGTDWVEEAKIIASDGAPADEFGTSVSLCRDTVLIGAHMADSRGPDSGAAYVFVRTGTRWTEVEKLVAADGAAHDRLGASVSLADGMALVGAHLADVNEEDTGAAYVFTRDGTAWNEEAKLTASDGTEFDTYGYAVAIDGQTALIGARNDRVNGKYGSGSAYVHARNGTDWVEEAKLVSANVSNFVFFGSAVSLSGDTALVAADLADAKGCNSGAAYVFTRDGTQWTAGEVLTAHETVAGDRFGSSVSLRGDAALVGSLLQEDRGSAYLFLRHGTAWHETVKLAASSGASGDFFGGSVALFRDTAVVGALGDNEKGSGAGAAYAYSLFPAPATYCTAKTNSLGCLPEIGFSGTPRASASTGFAVLATNMRNQHVGLLHYGLDGRAAIPYQGGLLCVATPVYRTPGRNSGGNRPPIADCSGVYRLDMNAFATGGAGGDPRPELRFAGTQVHCQWWARDLDDPFGTSLSDALEYTIAP